MSGQQVDVPDRSTGLARGLQESTGSVSYSTKEVLV